jgi:hypothetical protein
MPTPFELADTVLNALDALDVADGPHGLYSCHDLEPSRPPTSLYREWNVGLRPALEQLGATELSARSPFAEPSFHLAGLGLCELLIRRVATIKVRRFGSAYRVDDRVDRSEHWAAADVGALLNGLRYPRAERHRCSMVVLMGFAREEHPLERELRQIARDTKGLESAERSWPDRYGRAFSVGVTVWWRPSSMGQGSSVESLNR